MYTILAPSGDCKGVTLVIHGLNLRPDRMRPLADELGEMGIAVVLCSLCGHGENYTPIVGQSNAAARLAAFRQSTYAGWRKEVEAAYAATVALAQPTGAPLFLVAFSLGALLGCDLLTTSSTVHFDRMVLLAPALALRSYSHLPYLLSRWPTLALRSFAPRTYRSNPATPIAAYNALHTALLSLQRHADAKLNVPTLILIDPQDELVSPSGVLHFIQRTQLSQWRLSLVKKQPTQPELAFHHLIIDADSVGPVMWQRMVTQIREHLGGDKETRRQGDKEIKR